MPERLGSQNLLEVVPPKILEKLEPYRGKLDQVFQFQNDFAHLRYHVLDSILFLRHWDLSDYQFKIQASLAYWNDIAPRDFGEKLEILDLPTFHRVEKALNLHDIGRAFVGMDVLKPDEHHYGSLFVASIVDGDPQVCDAVYHHVDDVLPANSSKVTRCVRDLDRMVGAGYVGLIRDAIYQGFSHQLVEEKDEDKILKCGIMMAADRHGNIGEEEAKHFFWQNVFPFYESQGEEGLLHLATTSKIFIDRIVGRDYRGRSNLNVYERQVLEEDRRARHVEPVDARLKNAFSFKVKNTKDILSEARYGLMRLNARRYKVNWAPGLNFDEASSYL